MSTNSARRKVAGVLSYRALQDVAALQKEEGWTDDEKYQFSAREIMTFERDELSVINRDGNVDKKTQDRLREHDYSSVKYWDKRYGSIDMTYDWLVKFNSLKEVVEKYMKHDDAILIPGCGNSEFSLDLFDEGFTNTWSIDNSVVVINQMTNRQGYRPEMRFLVMDVCETSFDDGKFDVVFDKSLFDCLLCGGLATVRQYLAEMNRVLKSGGLFIVLSLHGTEALEKHMAEDLWKVEEFVNIPNPSYPEEPDEAESYWISVYRKAGDASPDRAYMEQKMLAAEQVQDGEGSTSGSYDGDPLGIADIVDDADSESQDEFEPTDRRTLEASPIFGGTPSRDLFESENWIEVDDIVNRVYPMNADASSDSSTLSTGGGMFLGNSISGADIGAVLAKAQAQARADLVNIAARRSK